MARNGTSFPAGLLLGTLAAGACASSPQQAPPGKQCASRPLALDAYEQLPKGSNLVPIISTGGPRHRGRAAPPLIRATVKKGFPKIKRCLESLWRTTDEIVLEVTVAWRLNADGSVSGAKVLERNERNDRFEQCLTAIVESWCFKDVVEGDIQMRLRGRLQQRSERATLFPAVQQFVGDGSGRRENSV